MNPILTARTIAGLAALSLLLRLFVGALKGE
jgi:hypothetical protein